MTEESSLVELFENTCERHAVSPALGRKVEKAFEWISYAELRAKVARARQLLLALGLRSGESVAVIADNCVEWAVLCYATASVGAVFVPLYSAQSADDWIYVINDCNARLCFVENHAIQASLLLERGRLPDGIQLISLKGERGAPGDLAVRLSELDGEPPPPYFPASTDLAAIIYTSGTTSRPKGVELTHANIVTNAVVGALEFPLDSRDRSLSFLPWAHALGQTIDLHLLLRLGVAIAINDCIAHLLHNLALAKPTVIIAVPRVFGRIYDNVGRQLARKPRAVRALFDRGIAIGIKRQNGGRLSLIERGLFGLVDGLLFSKVRQRFGGNLRFAICGSAALNREIAEFVTALGIQLYEGYGLTECSPVVSVNTPNLRRFGTVGPPLRGTRIQIDLGNSSDSLVGEIVVSGPSVMRGYHGLPDETAAVLSADGALRTGDLGYLDDAGCLVIRGRIKEQFKLENGEYVAPSPIEERIKLSPLVSQCLIFGDDRPHCVALIVPDWEHLLDLLSSENLSLEAMAKAPEVVRAVKLDVDRLCRDFRHFERPKRVLLLPEDFTVANGLLTPSQKLRRKEIILRYAGEIAASFKASTPREG